MIYAKNNMQNSNAASKGAQLCLGCVVAHLQLDNLLLGLLVGDLIDEQANSTLGDDVRDAVANLDVDNGAASTKANHWEQVHNWVCAPAQDGPHLSLLNLALDNWVSLLSSGSSEANKKLVDNI